MRIALSVCRRYTTLSCWQQLGTIFRASPLTRVLWSFYWWFPNVSTCDQNKVRILRERAMLTRRSIHWFRILGSHLWLPRLKGNAIRLDISKSTISTDARAVDALFGKRSSVPLCVQQMVLALSFTNLIVWPQLHEPTWMTGWLLHSSFMVSRESSRDALFALARLQSHVNGKSPARRGLSSLYSLTERFCPFTQLSVLSTTET